MNLFSPLKYSWIVLGFLWLAHAIQFLNFSSLGILAPLIMSDLRLSAMEFGLFSSALFIGSILVQVPVGLITDRVGVRAVFAAGVGMMGLSLAAFSFASSFPAALALLFVYGLASGVVPPVANKSVLEWFPPVGRATAMAVKQTGANAGSILGGILLPALILAYTWRESLLIVAIAEAAFAPLFYKLIRDRSRRDPGSGSPGGKIWQVFFHRKILILGWILFCFMASQFCFNAYLTLFLTRELAYSVKAAGYFYALAFAAGAVARMVWSFLSDYRLGGRRKGLLFLISLFLFLSTSYLTVLAFFPAASRFLWWALLLFGISGIGWNAILLTLIAEAVEGESVGLATGATFIWGYLGSLLGPPIFGLLVDATGSYGWGWLFLVGCALAAMILLAFYKEPRRQ